MSDKRDEDGAGRQITRGARGRWLPGQSANPGGRRATPKEVVDFIGGHTLEAAKRLVEIMRGKDPQQARLAAEALLDRHLGRPTQQVDLNARRLDPDAVGGAPDQARARLEALIAEAEGRSTDTQTVAVDGQAQAARGLAPDVADAVASGLPGSSEGSAP